MASGRAITSRPFYWSDVDQRIYGLADDETPRVSRRQVLERYTDYAEQEEQAAGQSDRHPSEQAGRQRYSLLRRGGCGHCRR